MTVAGTYRQIDHTGDVGIEARAPDEEALFACCAEAMFDILAGGTEILPGEAQTVRLEAPDRERLLVRWLQELLYLHDAERWLFTRFEVHLDSAAAGVRVLRGRAVGEKFDAARHVLSTELKAVTYHQLEVRREPGGGWRARVIFDI